MKNQFNGKKLLDSLGEDYVLIYKLHPLLLNDSIVDCDRKKLLSKLFLL